MSGVKGQKSGGHNAKTVEAHRLQGTFKKERHAGYSSPQAPKGRPVPPKKLTGDAADEWDRMVGRLEISKTLSLIDDAALYQYCRRFAETEALADRQAEVATSIELLEENLSDLQGAELVACFQEITKMRQLEAGYISKVAKGRMDQRVYLVEFGMTPASRGRVKIAEPETEKDPFAMFDAGTGTGDGASH